MHLRHPGTVARVSNGTVTIANGDNAIVAGNLPVY